MRSGRWVTRYLCTRTGQGREALLPGLRLLARSAAFPKQRPQVRLVVGHAPGEQPLPVIVQNIGEVLTLADIQPDPHIHLRRSGRVSTGPAPAPVAAALPPADAGRADKMSTSRPSRSGSRRPSQTTADSSFRYSLMLPTGNLGFS